MEPLTGDDPVEVAGYRLRGRLGAGGMGRVYLAFTPGGRPVALKVVRPELGDDGAFRDRFRQEIAAAQRVHGLYTAQVLDGDPDAVPPWLVTAYVAGPSLQQAVADHGPVPVASVFLLVAGVAEALQAIHAAGVVHRDLKPSNVLLAPDGPRVIDFGIARAVEATALTRTGMRVGSPQFMAPEQVRGGAVAAAADVFALGALAGYAALGRPPFGEGGETAVLYRVVHEEPDLDGCPGELRALIGRCLAKDPAARPAPAEIIDSCRARSAVKTVEFTESWLPPAIAAGLTRHAVPAASPPPWQAAPPATAQMPAPAKRAGHAAGLTVPPASAEPPAAAAAAATMLPTATGLPAAAGPAAPPARADAWQQAAQMPPPGTGPTRAHTLLDAGGPLGGRWRPSRTVVIAGVAAAVLLVALAGYSTLALARSGAGGSGSHPAAGGGSPGHARGTHPKAPAAASASPFPPWTPACSAPGPEPRRTSPTPSTVTPRSSPARAQQSPTSQTAHGRSHTRAT